MAGFWGRSRRAQEVRQRQDAQNEQDAALSRRAATALVEADERLRLTADELDFARAELGESATRDLAEALTSVRHHLGEAFHLHQLCVDDIPDTPQELRERHARIIQLADWSRDLLEERTGALEHQIAAVRQAPAVIENVRAQADAVRARLPQVSDAVARLALRYSPGALRQVSVGPQEVSQLLSFADHSLEIAARRRKSGQAEAATLALEAATEGVRRATSLLDGVEAFEIEALRAESTLAAVVADSRSDLLAARAAPATPQVTTAVTELQDALAALPAPGALSDPFADLTRLRTANAALDTAIAAAQERAARPLPTPAQLTTAIEDAERQLSIAREVVSGHRGWIGADARTRLAEAERTLTDVHRSGGGEENREQAFALARRAADLASESLRLAQRDIDGARDGAGGLERGGLGGRPRSNDLGGLLGGVLGGLVLGDIVEDLFD